MSEEEQEIDYEWLKEFAEQERKYYWGKQIKLLLNYTSKLQKENEDLRKCLKADEKYAEGLKNDIKSLLNIEPNDNFVSKDKIREFKDLLLKELDRDFVTEGYRQAIGRYFDKLLEGE